MWAALRYPAMKFPYWSLVLLGGIQGNAQAVTDLATVPSAAKMFPKNRGAAIGITKSFVGLSGAMVTTIYIGELPLIAIPPQTNMHVSV
jgi:hypothetical protein